MREQETKGECAWDSAALGTRPIQKHFKRTLNVYAEFIPQLLFLLCIFGPYPSALALSLRTLFALPSIPLPDV